MSKNNSTTLPIHSKGQPTSTAVVLAAGEGNRLHPLTENRPKPMLPAATKPILEHVFDQLIDAGLEQIIVVVGYRRDRIQSYFGPSYRNVPLTYITQEKQLGTGHAILTAESAVDGAFVVINGDQIVDRRIIQETLEAHDSDATATIALLQRSNIEEYGGVLLEDDRVTRIVENPRTDHEYYLNAGIYVLETGIFDGVRAADTRDGERLLVDGLETLIETGNTVRGSVSDGRWVDATYPWDLLDVSVELFESDLVDGRQTASVADSATVHDAAVLQEPIVVDQDCVIKPGAVVGPYTCLGENTTVGANAVVERSVVDTDTRIEANATVIDCVTGTGVTIGPGSTIPGGPGDVRVADRVYENEALGAVLADRVSDHGNVTYVPGTLVGPDTHIYHGTTVRGTIDGDTEVRS